MPDYNPEDYSVDMRTILAKERTLMAEQRLQLSIVSVGAALFLAGFTLLKFFENHDWHVNVIEWILIASGLALSGQAVVRYKKLGVDVDKTQEFEHKRAYDYMNPQKKKK